MPLGTTTVAFEYRVPGAQLAHLMKLEPQQATDETALLLWQRFLCHALISSLPDGALSEAEERLAEIYEDRYTFELNSAVTSTMKSGTFIAEQGRRHPRPEIALED